MHGEGCADGVGAHLRAVAHAPDCYVAVEAVLGLGGPLRRWAVVVLDGVLALALGFLAVGIGADLLDDADVAVASEAPPVG